jgi:pyruvate dehydrogenase E1 component beta subunit
MTTGDGDMEKVRVREAIKRALADEMAADPTVVCMGEDIGAAGGAFKVTEGLIDEFGPERVMDTPISETGFLGAAVGAAMAGYRPIVEMMFIDFTGVALDQLVTEAVNVRYLSRGELTVPLVLRGSAGAGLGFGCQHSGMLDRWFRGTPGLKVGVVSGAAAAYEMHRAAVRDPDPVVVLEPRALYARREEIEYAAVVDSSSIGRSALAASGQDLTIVTAGQMVGVALQALASSSWTADVIDLRWLAPWDVESVLASVRRTGRLVTLEETPESGGWGSDVITTVLTELHGTLDAPPSRVCPPLVPVPFSGALEDHYLPSSEYLAHRVEASLRGSPPVHWWSADGVAA